jgi:hypothetical protein
MRELIDIREYLQHVLEILRGETYSASPCPCSRRGRLHRHRLTATSSAQRSRGVP